MTRHLTRSTIAMLFAAGALALALAPLRSPQRPSTVASVDLEKTFKNINLYADGTARLKQLAADLDAQLKQREQVVKDLSLELDSFEIGSASYLTTQTKVEQAVGEYRAFDQFTRLKLEVEQAKLIRLTYDAIKECAKQLAADRGVDFVLMNDSIPDFQNSDSDQTVKQISARRVLYANPEFDITADLIACMNAGGASASTASVDTSGTSP